jgi:hypothetical protein
MVNAYIKETSCVLLYDSASLDDWFQPSGRNVVKNSDDTAVYPRRPESSETPLLTFKISQFFQLFSVTFCGFCLYIGIISVEASFVRSGIKLGEFCASKGHEDRMLSRR